MQIDGVYDAKTDTLSHTVTVTFNPEKTNIAALTKVLSDEDFPIAGEPVFIK